MMKKVFLMVFFLPAVSHAVICKYVDADGVVGYTDVPAGECQQKVELPDYSRYAPRPIAQKAEGVPGETATDASAPFVRYKKIQITQPEANGTVRSNEGIVSVVLALDPPLQEGHRIKVYVDGGAVPGEFDGPAIELAGLERGTHSLRAVVSDAGGKRMGDSQSVRFTLRKTTLYDQKRMEPPKPTLPIEPPPENPIEPGPENPIEPAPGEPVPTPLPVTGPTNYGTGSGTNPAFKPNYTR